MAQTLQRGLQDLRIELSILTDKIAQAAGLNPRDLDVLDVVVHDGGLTPKQLAERTGIHPATLTGVLARLYDEGWVTRTRDPIDGRSVLIQLEPTRVAQLEVLYAPANELLGQTFDRLTPAHASAILPFLANVTAAAKYASQQLRPEPWSGSGPKSPHNIPKGPP